MGSRIHIKLTDLLHNPLIQVTLITSPVAVAIGSYEHERVAQLKFVNSTDSRTTDLLYTLDYVCFEGRVTLEGDFNFFRYDVDAPQRKLMKLLYEHSVCFSITH